MSQAPSEEETDDLRERISLFVTRNFPQIQMHGGSASITHLDKEEGEVAIQLGGACSGCGISPMTIQALKSRMTDEIPEINTVHAQTGEEGGISPSFPGDTNDDDGSDVPF